MKDRRILVITATAMMLASEMATAQSVQQATTARNAPMTAIAIGPSRAAIELNTVHNLNPLANTSYIVSVHRPLTAVALPGWNVTLRVGGQR